MAARATAARCATPKAPHAASYTTTRGTAHYLGQPPKGRAMVAEKFEAISLRVAAAEHRAVEARPC
jgi:hypothetical protein